MFLLQRLDMEWIFPELYFEINIYLLNHGSETRNQHFRLIIHSIYIIKSLGKLTILFQTQVILVKLFNHTATV